MYASTRIKTLIAAIAGLVIALSLTACGGSGDDSSGTDQNGGNDAAASDTVFTVAMEAGYAPYNWTQPTADNGAVPIKDSSEYANGYDVMMAKKIADANGWDLEIVKLDWDSLVMAVQSGTVDAVIAGQSITSERAQQVDFSEPYYYATIRSLVKADSPYADAQSINDFAGAKVTSQMNTIWYDVCIPQIDGAEVLPAAADAPSMLVQLESNAADVIVTDRPTAQAAVIAYPNFVELDFGEGEGDFEVTEEDVNIGISVKKGNSELLADINAVLDTMTEADYDAMMEEAISVQPLSN